MNGKEERDNLGEIFHRAMPDDLPEAVEQRLQARLAAFRDRFDTAASVEASNDRPPDSEVTRDRASYLESTEQRLHHAELARADAEVRVVRERTRRWVERTLAASLLLVILLAGGGWLRVMDRRAAREREMLSRRAETELAVGLALGQAEQLRKQASHPQAETLMAAEEQLALWREATTALEQAVAAGDVDAETRQRVDDLRAELEEGTRRGEAACRVARLLSDLDEARSARTDPGDSERLFNNKAAALAFARAFSTFGLNVLQLRSKDVAARLRSLDSKPRTAVALGLDYWAACADDATLRDRLQTVAAAIDDDPWRQRLRKARDRESLESLAAEATTRELPAASLNLLADALLDVDARPAAYRVLDRATGLYPEDFWSHFRYAEQLRKTARDDGVLVQDMLRHAWAAVAARPQTPEAYHLLAWCLARAGDSQGATVALNRAIKLQPRLAATSRGLLAELRKRQTPASDADREPADPPAAASPQANVKGP